MIVGPAVGIAASVRGERDDDIAKPCSTEAEGSARRVGVVAGQAPCGGDCAPGTIRQLGKERMVGFEGHFLGRGCQPIEQRAGRRGDAFDLIARLRKHAQHFKHTLRHIQPDGIACPARRARIVRHDDHDLALVTGCRLKCQEAGDPVRNLFDPVRFRPVDEAGGIVAFLEGKYAGKNSSVQFRQDHVHGKIRRIETATALRPAGLPGGCDNDLEDRHAGVIEDGLAAFVSAACKCRGRQDGRRFDLPQCLSDEAERLCVLQSGDKDRNRNEATVFQSAEKCVDRCRVVGKQHRAVEEDRQARCRSGGPIQQIFQFDNAMAGSIKARLRHCCGWIGIGRAVHRQSR